MNLPVSPVVGRLANLRHALATRQCSAVVIPTADPHLSEYPCLHWQGRCHFSGFNGSVGTLVVTQDFAGLWVDGRYWVQAELQLAGSGIELVKSNAVGSISYVDWLAANVPAGGSVAVDGDVLALATHRAMQSAFGPRNIALRTDLDIPGAAWTDRPDLPRAAIYEHVAPHATQTRKDKLAWIRAEMRRAGAGWHLLSTLDDIAWTFNLRGSDVDYNPVFVGHALIGPDSATLFVLDGKIDAALRDRLGADGVKIAPYREAKAALAAMPAASTLLYDPDRIVAGVAGAFGPGVRTVEAINPSVFAKSKKNAAEAAHVRAAMEQDGAALCEFFSWLESAFASGERITELTIDKQIRAARARQPGFVGPSFATIAAFNANGASPHYHASAESHAVIEGDGLLLIDSGGQYPGGTTDITRVVGVGKVTDEQRGDYTRVLKGTIRLSRARFPAGTFSTTLDALARAEVWAGNADYAHGTGHGVGYFLCVHEGPQSISPSAARASHVTMQAGMITSIEPGLYRKGRWGIRIENLGLAVPAGSSEFGDFLAFETLTLCPIETRCIDFGLLEASERDWLNEYHRTVRERLRARVSGAALDWLMRTTEPV